MTHLKAILLVICTFFGGSLLAQPETGVARFENGSLSITLDKRWSAAVQGTINAQYNLDSAMVANIFSGKLTGSVKDNGENWTITPIDAHRIEISKPLEGSLDGESWKSTWAFDPGARKMLTGHGYVDLQKVVYGRNQLMKTSLIRMKSGKMKLVVTQHMNAGQVLITGSFSNWTTEGLPMTKSDKGWEIELSLEPGKYLYKFIVDGQWKTDTGNKLREKDGFGGYNSVLYVSNKRFELEGFENAKNVVLTGSFNGWNRRELKMNKTPKGWMANVYLKEGTHTYKFLVDGEWMSDPANPDGYADGFGSVNSVVLIGEPSLFYLTGYASAKSVFLAGNFNGWKPDELPMTKTSSGWETPYVLGSGNYEYKYVVDGKWITDPGNPYIIRNGGEENSFIAIRPNHIFKYQSPESGKKVVVTGNFTGWNEQNYLMVRSGNTWSFPVFLPPGKYTYKLLIDGVWTLDPDNPYFEENEFGTDNSVLWIDVDMGYGH